MGSLQLQTEAGAKENRTNAETVEGLLGSKTLFIFKLRANETCGKKKSLSNLSIMDTCCVCSDQEAMILSYVFLWSRCTFSLLITHFRT